MTLDEIRKKINTIDFEILKLLNSRMEFALRTKKFKSGVSDPKRETEVIEFIRRHSQGLIEPAFCMNLFQEIILESKRLQAEEVRLMGFQGEHGSHGEVAARQFSPDSVFISCQSHSEIFDGVEHGLLHFGIVPIESTLGGTLTDVNELLVTKDLRIVGEIRQPIHECLLTLPETDPMELRVVYSHRQVLSHCQEYLERHRLEARPFHDAAAAAKMLVQERREASAVVAGRFCAEFYNLKVVAENVEDHPGNMTRFLVIARDGSSVTGNKSSIVFAAAHKAGSLFSILKEFADQEINLTRIESMPNRQDPGNYMFFLDFYGSPEEEAVREVLSRVQEKAFTYKLLGCYPAAE